MPRASRARRAKNFYYSFLLSRPGSARRDVRIYAFMRHCDDLSDEPGATAMPHRPLARRDRRTRSTGRFSDHPLWPPFTTRSGAIEIPHQYFHDMIDGVTSDLEPRRIQTFDELYRYCYQVASRRRLDRDPHLRLRPPSALPLAEKCGVAFQLTNILRDVREDSPRGRIYLPPRTCDRFGVSEQICAGRNSEASAHLMRFEAARARELLRRIAAAAGPDSPAQPALAVGADRDLLRAAGSHRSVRLRRAVPPRAAVRRSRNRGS